MNRQGFLRILLSLLLLLTQQMGLSHALSHLGTAQPPAVLGQQGEDGDEDGRAKSLALDAGCQQCLAFAQLAGPLGSKTVAFALPDLADTHFILAVADGQPRHSACPFQSRAPPLA